MVKKPSYPRKEAPQPIKRKAGLISDRGGAQENKMTGKGLQRKMENGPEETWKPQRPPRSTSARTATTLFASAVYPSDSHSVAGLARSAKRTVPEVAIQDEVRPRHKR